MLSTALNTNRPATRNFQSSDPGEVVDYVGRTLAPHRMDMDDPKQMTAKLRCFEVAPAHIVDIQYGTDVWIDPGELESHFLIHAALQGVSAVWAGGVECEMRTDNVHISSPGAAMKIHMTPECRHLTVRIAAATFEDYLARVMNIPVNRPVVFYPEQEKGQDLPVVWRNLVRHLVDQIVTAPTLMANSRTQRQYAVTMVEMLLSNYRNSYSDQIALYGNDISPWHVRKARDIIHDSFDDAVSVTDLARRVGVSVRSLQNGFRQFLGMTPVEYVRRHRLEKLHRALMEGDPDSSVTELMLECGIMNFGRYAQYYRQQYGCRPSETLRNRRVI
ncbi:MAG: AraC family transcriptional regulator [Sphingobium sp.]|nr:MAG: AraC family transcriptional regulator [Sphingobium sp.]